MRSDSSVKDRNKSKTSSFRGSLRVPSVFFFTENSFFDIMKKAVRFFLQRLSYRVKGVNSVKDTEIIELLHKRDESALSVIKMQYGALCRQLAVQILGNEEDADECMNDALLRLWNSIPPAEPEFLKAYLAATVRNLALNRHKSERSRKHGSGQIPAVLDELAEITPSGQDVAADVEQRLLQDAVRAFVRQQPEKHQRIFMQRYFYMMQLREIAEENGITENSVTVTLHRLRKKLQDTLRKEQYI